jgi:hypothetical protein
MDFSSLPEYPVSRNGDPEETGREVDPGPADVGYELAMVVSITVILVLFLAGCLLFSGMLGVVGGVLPM